MSSSATSNQALPRLAYRRSVLGVRVGQFVGWQIVAVAVAVALATRGPVSWALSGVALAGFGLTMLRWRRRWAYEWLATAWTHRQRSGWTLPPIDICPARLRSGAEAGIAHDGGGFSVIVAIAPQPSGPPDIELPVAALAGLLDSQDATVSAVQLVLHAEPAAVGPSVLATAYRNLGYSQVPRSQSAWLALRHDPALSRYAIGSAGGARDLQVSLLRSLAGRGSRAIDVLSGVSLGGQVLDVSAARELLTRTLIAAPASGEGQAAGAAPGASRGAWQSSGQQHVTYWLRNWPAGAIGAVQHALSTVPARSVTTSVLVTAAAAGRFGLTATVRVTTSVDADQAEVDHAVRSAAASCGARLVRLDGEHIDGVLATLPLGRPPAGRSLGGRTGGTHESGPGAFLPISFGGVVIGPQVGGEDDGCPVAVPFFRADDSTRTAIVGDPVLHRLLGLRALGSGARLQVVTSQPGPWLRLRNLAQQADRMTVVRPGKQPPSDGTRADPWMLIDDTGSPAIATSRPWLAVVTALNESANEPASESANPSALQPGLDAIVLQRSSRRIAASLASSLSLPNAARSLQAIPDGQVAVARRGLIQFARLVPDDAERSILARSMQPS
jgi:type VII secretion protein EccE